MSYVQPSVKPRLRDMKVGVFDSGVGGQAIVNAIKCELPEIEVLYADDHKNVPYGNKPPATLLKLVLPILQDLQKNGCQAIVVACNTVTTTIIEQLRSQLAVPLVAVEPMVRPAAELSTTGVIAVCATPATLASPRYRWLKESYAAGLSVLEPDCSDWAYMIESNAIDHEKIRALIKDVIVQQADVIVLGCTHYHWIEVEIKKLAGPRVMVMQPELALLKQLKRVLKRLV
jgi:glutamate racemase